MLKCFGLLIASSVLIGAAAPDQSYTGPIIDMHLHAYLADAQGPPPVVVCAPYDDMPARDPQLSDAQCAADTFKVAHCRHPIWSAPNDDAVRERSLAVLRRFNIIAVTTGPALER